MQRDWDRLAPWTGIAFVVLVVLGAVTAGSAPSAAASGTKVIAFYSDHRSAVHTSAVLLTLAFIALLLFAGVLRVFLRQRGSDGLAATLLAGAAILTVGQAISASLSWALSDTPSALSPDAAQALNVAANDLVLVSAAGWFIFAVTAWVVVLRYGGLPKWMGWVSLVIAVLVVSPAEFIAFLLFVGWIAVAAVLMIVRSPKPTPAVRQASPASAG